MPSLAYLKISLIKCSNDYDLDDRFELKILREELYPLYSLAKGKLKKEDNNSEFEIAELKKHVIFSDSFSFSDLYEHS